MSICLSRLRDTRIEEDSDNSTPSKDLLVRNVFEEFTDEETCSTKCGNRLASIENIPHEEAFIGSMIF